MPLPDIQSVLKDLEASLAAGRTEGKIQTVACQLSDILANYLKSDRILFEKPETGPIPDSGYSGSGQRIDRSHYHPPPG
jgi:hypothetical protein